MYCTQCGTELKEGARFCHKCGASVESNEVGANAEAGNVAVPGVQKSWLSQYGAYLFIPLFAIIVALLFWVNKEPDNLGASGQPTQGQQAPSFDMNKVHETLDRLQTALKEDPKNVVAMDSLAMMYAIAGSYEKAKGYYEQHLQIEPDNRDIQVALALIYHNLQNDPKAIEILQGILDKEPGYAFALHYLAEIYASQHEHDKATQYWQKIIKLYPGTEMAKVAEKRIQEQTDGE